MTVVSLRMTCPPSAPSPSGCSVRRAPDRTRHRVRPSGAATTIPTASRRGHTVKPLPGSVVEHQQSRALVRVFWQVV